MHRTTSLLKMQVGRRAFTRLIGLASCLAILCLSVATAKAETLTCETVRVSPFGAALTGTELDRCKAMGSDRYVLRQRYARLGCTQDLVACVDAESGRIVSRYMTATPFVARSGELWTVKVVGPRQMAGNYTFEEHRASQLYSIARGAHATGDRRSQTDLRNEVKESVATLKAVDTSKANSATADAATKVVENKAPSAVTISEAEEEANKALTRSASGGDASVVGALRHLHSALVAYRRLVESGSSTDAELLASYSLTIAEDITVGRQTVSVAASDRKEMQATIVFQIVDHGRYVVDFALGGTIVADGSRTYTVVPQADGSGRISTETYAATGLGFFMNVFPGGHRKGIIAPWLPADKGDAGSFLRDMVALQLGLGLDFAHISDLERFARRGFVGVAVEPVTGLALSSGVAMGIENTLRDGVLTLPSGSSQVPESSYRDTFKVRWYFAVTLSPEIVSMARVALSGAAAAASNSNTNE